MTKKTTFTPIEHLPQGTTIKKKLRGLMRLINESKIDHPLHLQEIEYEDGKPIAIWQFEVARFEEPMLKELV